MTEKIKILGPPGCGKTYTLMAKYASLLNNGYRVEDITCTTFRRSSANDLITKVREWTEESQTLKNHVNSLHSICYRLLGGKSYAQVIQPNEIRHFAKDCGYEAYLKNATITSVSDDDESVYSGELLDLYTWLRNTHTPVEKWYRYPGADNVILPASKVPDFIADYERYKQKIGRIDFSDMIEHVIQEQTLLDTPVLMVDEFQDLTRQQFDLFSMWVNGCESVTIAGDPLQSIYGFWGGSPDYFNEWKGKEIIMNVSHRLKTPVWKLATEILRAERQRTPDVETSPGNNKSISCVLHGEELPTNQASELHLVRCNYQAPAIAMKLAQSGRIFGGSCGWSESEINLFNTLLKARAEAPLLSRDVLTLVENYPDKYFKHAGRKADFVEYLKTDYRPTLAAMNPHIKLELYNIINSNTPAAYISECGNLKSEKINNAISKNPNPISPDDLKQCQILTIHGAKGLEADTVYLHTGITPRVKKALVIPCEESEAEARVWYVGVTRAKHHLCLVHDSGYNYQLPGMN